jgi:hypothetical protein
MTHTQPTNHALITLALLSILFGMVMVEMMFFVEQLPAWGLLPAFFAAGIMYKFLGLLHRYTSCTQPLPRVVTVEFEWPILRREVSNGHYV